MTVLQKGVKKKKEALKNIVMASTSGSSDDESADVESQILQQLQCMNKHLDEVEQKVDKSRSAHQRKGKVSNKSSKHSFHGKKK